MGIRPQRLIENAYAVQPVTRAVQRAGVSRFENGKLARDQKLAVLDEDVSTIGAASLRADN
jgi:hypothetical protein